MTLNVMHSSDKRLDIAVLEGIATRKALEQVCRCVADQSVFADCGGLVIDVTDIQSTDIPALGELEQTAHALAGQHRWFAVVDEQHRAGNSVPGLVYGDKPAALGAIRRLGQLVAVRAPRHPTLTALTDLVKIVGYPVMHVAVRATLDLAATPSRLCHRVIGR